MNTAFARGAFIFQGPRLWRRLPLDLREIHSTKVFVNRYKKKLTVRLYFGLRCLESDGSGVATILGEGYVRMGCKVILNVLFVHTGQYQMGNIVMFSLLNYLTL